MLDTRRYIDGLQNGTIFTENDVLVALNLPTNKLTTIRWDLYHLYKNNVIIKVKKKTYQKSNKKIFSYELISEFGKNVFDLINKKYPNVKWNIFEYRFLNNWINLLVFDDIVFLEAENIYIDFIFDVLKENNKYLVLINPTVDELLKYKNGKTIVLKSMISKAPYNHNHFFPFEKMVVDFSFDKFYSKFINKDECMYLLTALYKNYILNTDTVISYSKRRNKEYEARKLLYRLEKDYDFE